MIRARLSTFFSRPLHGLRLPFALIPAVNCWATIIRPLSRTRLRMTFCTKPFTVLAFSRTRPGFWATERGAKSLRRLRPIFANAFGFAPKVSDRSGMKSVRPAVAGGSTIRPQISWKYLIPITDPPATADFIATASMTFEASRMLFTSPSAALEKGI